MPGDPRPALAGIVPVILSGGSGSRLWPLSRVDRPKQFLALIGARSMVQETVARVPAALGFAPPLVVCAADHRAAMAAQLSATLGAAPRMLLEPVGRNTAPAIAVAALALVARDPDALMLVLPADHHVADTEGLHRAVARAAPAAQAGWLVTFGMRPSAPETGYGYILPGGALPGLDGVDRVERFIEKPPRNQAEAFLAGGRHLWNSGMFLFGAARLIAELRRHAPGVVEAVATALDRATPVPGRAEDGGTLLLDAEAFAAAPSISIDHAVMERTDAAATVPAAIGWTDVGSWASLWEIAARDADGNAVLGGEVAMIDSRDCLVRSDGVATATIGVEGLVVIGSRDGVLVARRDRLQEVRVAAARFDGAGAVARAEPSTPAGGEAPAGRHRLRTITVDGGAGRTLAAPPGCSLALTILEGRGGLTIGSAEVPADAGTVHAIPPGTTARIDNPGPAPLVLIEIAVETCGG